MRVLRTGAWSVSDMGSMTLDRAQASADEWIKTGGLAAEVGDLFFALAAFANVNGIRLEEAMGHSLAKYTERDAPAWAQQPREERP